MIFIDRDYGGELSQLTLAHLVTKDKLKVSKQTIQRILAGIAYIAV